jgi:uncharacterized protein (DUF3084 family)
MPKAQEPVSTVGRVVFELDRFEFSPGDCCEVRGRWFGVRGRRFMRPALVAVIDGHQTRLLADIADKPWAPEDGEPWKAAFPWPAEIGELLDPELTVAPDLTISLPLPAGRAVPSKRKPTPGHTAAPRIRARGGELAGLRREVGVARDQQDALQRQLADAAAEKERATARTDELLGNLNQVVRERDQAKEAREQLAAEREALRRESEQIATKCVALRGESDELRSERDALRRESDDFRSERDALRCESDQRVADRNAAIAVRDQSASERDALRRESDQLAAERDQAASERDAAVKARDRAASERDAALAARDRTRRDRDALARTSEQLQSQVASLVSARGASLVMRQAADEGPASRRYAGLLPRAIALIMLLVAIAVVLSIFMRAA